MQIKMTAREARDNFTDLLGGVYYGKQVVEIQKKGRVFAVVLNPDEYVALRNAAKGKFFRIVEKIQSVNRGAVPSAVLDKITQGVELVRQKKYAPRRQA